jgi:putative transposase
MFEILKEIKNNPEKLFEMMRIDVKETIGKYLSELMKVELSDFLGREHYQRKDSGDNTNHRNGYYGRRFTFKRIGEVNLTIPRDRFNEFNTKVLPRSKRYEDDIRNDICLMYLTGVSTRTLSMISSRLIGRKISHTEVSNTSKELTQAVESWRNRNLSKENIKYLFIDGVCFSMRIKGSIEIVSVLVVIGVRDDGHRLVLSIQSGDKESASNWRELFKDLKSRGLNPDNISLGIMDGLSGLEKVFKEEFNNAKVQRCQVHVARNVLAKVPVKLKQKVADDLRSIFYASSRDKSIKFFSDFKEKWIKETPSAVKCIENSIDSCLTFFSFPEDEWISLRTTNIIERINKEFKRRTKPMEILAGEQSCYNILAFISIKMELYWRKNPVGRVQRNLPFFQNMMETDLC